jgi:hypothetical protein
VRPARQGDVEMPTDVVPALGDLTRRVTVLEAQVHGSARLLAELAGRVLALEAAMDAAEARVEAAEGYLDRCGAALDTLTAAQWQALEELRRVRADLQGWTDETAPRRRRTH